MWSLLTASLCVLLAFATQIQNCSDKKEIKMSDQTLTVEVKCKNNPECLFDDDDIFIEIFVINRSGSDVGFPLEFAREKGPGVKLIDTETKKESLLSTHLADWDLKDEFVQIKPGDSVTIEWVVTEDELTQFGHKKVDLTIEVSLAEEIIVGGKKEKFKGTAQTRVVSKDKQNTNS